jgi:hypothetical protein
MRFKTTMPELPAEPLSERLRKSLLSTPTLDVPPIGKLIQLDFEEPPSDKADPDDIAMKG